MDSVAQTPGYEVRIGRSRRVWHRPKVRALELMRQNGPGQYGREELVALKGKVVVAIYGRDEQVDLRKPDHRTFLVGRSGAWSVGERTDQSEMIPVFVSTPARVNGIIKNWRKPLVPASDLIAQGRVPLRKAPRSELALLDSDDYVAEIYRPGDLVDLDRDYANDFRADPAGTWRVGDWFNRWSGGGPESRLPVFHLPPHRYPKEELGPRGRGPRPPELHLDTEVRGWIWPVVISRRRGYFWYGDEFDFGVDGRDHPRGWVVPISLSQAAAELRRRAKADPSPQRFLEQVRRDLRAHPALLRAYLRRASERRAGSTRRRRLVE